MVHPYTGRVFFRRDWYGWGKRIIRFKTYYISNCNQPERLLGGTL